jgi:L-seryl-tRNA(Ser) seleniumtransferase
MHLRIILLPNAAEHLVAGGFRFPAIMRESGARLVEVGTTNKTRLADYAEALTDRTAAMLRVHSSNVKIVEFTEDVGMAALAALAHERGLPLVDRLHLCSSTGRACRCS